MTMRILLIVCVVLLPGWVMGQYALRGAIENEAHDEIGFCHVYNITAKAGKVADLHGKFQVIANKGDTVRFSFVGYRTLYLPIEYIHLTNFVKVTMQEDSLLLPAITIYADPYFKVPLNFQGEPIFIPGVSVEEPRREMAPGTFGTTGSGVAIYGPITYFSKDARLQRKAQELFLDDSKTITYQKFMAQDSVKIKLMDMYAINSTQYDQVVVQLNQQFPGIQQARKPTEIWNWLLAHFDRAVPFVKGF